MIGNIYTDQRCWVCGGRLKHDPQRGGCFCPEHHEMRASKRFMVKFGRGIRRRFPSYDVAARFLNGLRFKHDEGSFDPRDYQASNPMGFEGLAEAFVREKRRENITDDYKDKIELHMSRAIEMWGEQNVKSIGRRDIKHFILDLPVGNKTMADHVATLRMFFATYLVSEEIIELHQVPKLPEIKFVMGWRAFTTWEDQERVVVKLREMRDAINPKVSFGVDMLRTYTSMRPADLRRIREGDFDLEAGTLTIIDPTKRSGQRLVLKLVDEHVKTVREMKQRWPAMPGVPFFRHHGRVKSVRADQPFGRGYVYRWWMRAAAECGVHGVDLYGGTKHTTTTELATMAGREAAKELSGHKTDRAFGRYCQTGGEGAHQLADLVRRVQQNKGKVVKIKRGEG